MGNQVGVWLDGTKAIVVEPTSGSIKEIVANIDNRVHHVQEGQRTSFAGERLLNHEKKFDERKKHQTNDYLKDVISEIKSADSIYLFGPANMKTHLKTEIIKDKNLKDKLVGVESADSMTNNQIVAHVKKYFTPPAK